MLKCVIIDDEPLAQEGLASYVNEIDFLHLVGMCEDPIALMGIIETQQVDLIFLDIQMPRLNGIDFLKVAQKLPMVIITTAFPSYALEGYQLNVLDYLLKPITFERFFKAANKAKEIHNSNIVSSTIKENQEDYIFIKCGSKYKKIFLKEILYIEGMQNYVNIFSDKGKYLTLVTMKNVEESLDSKQFLRVHKSFIVAISKIDGIEGNEIFIQNNRIPISRNLQKKF